METSFICDHSRHRVTVTRVGEISLSELVTTIEKMRLTEVWNYSVLVDARQARASLSTVESSQLAQRISSIGDGADRGPIAVVTSDVSTYRAVRLFGAFAARIGMRVAPFRNLPEAEHWLIEDGQLGMSEVSRVRAPDYTLIAAVGATIILLVVLWWTWPW